MRSFVIALFAAAALFPHAPANAVSVSTGEHVEVEDLILGEVNAIRSRHGLTAWLSHSGLRENARAHSQDMAARRSLDHRGFEQRVVTARPDPMELGRSADSGINSDLAACENAAYRFRAGKTPEPVASVAKGIANQFFNSPPHRDCLLDVWGASLNAVGIGAYRDSIGVWWVTLDAARDANPPGGCQTRAGQMWASAC